MGQFWLFTWSARPETVPADCRAIRGQWTNACAGHPTTSRSASSSCESGAACSAHCRSAQEKHNCGLEMQTVKLRTSHYNQLLLGSTDAGDFQAGGQQHRFVHGECRIQVVVLQNVAAHLAVLLAAQLRLVHVYVACDAVTTVTHYIRLIRKHSINLFIKYFIFIFQIIDKISRKNIAELFNSVISHKR